MESPVSLSGEDRITLTVLQQYPQSAIISLRHSIHAAELRTGAIQGKSFIIAAEIIPRIPSLSELASVLIHIDVRSAPYRVPRERSCFFPMGVRHTAHKSHKTVCHSDVWRKEIEMEDEIYLSVF